MENKKDLVLDVEENPKKISQWILFAIQHILAMLVACITVPLIMGNTLGQGGVGVTLPIGATLIAAGIGTLIYTFITRKKSPVFLSSSFAYLAPMVSALTLGVVDNLAGPALENLNYWALIVGMLIVGLIYVIIAIIIKFVGTKWLNRLLPPIVIGPIIMVIGLSLSSSAIGNLSSVAIEGGNKIMSIVIGLTAVIITAVCSHYGKKMISLIPFVCGMGGAYILALILTLIGIVTKQNWLQIIDFSPLVNADWNSINTYITTDFVLGRAIKQQVGFGWDTLLSVIIIFSPVALVTICEHIGDHKNLGNIINRDLINDQPGLSRTLIGDGLATAVSGVVCGAANTTYGENVAVIGVSKIASINVIILASIFSIFLGFFGPLTLFLETIPACITGGVSLILYGFIASSGVKMLINEKIDFSITKNVIVASVILVSGIGGLVINIGSATLTSTAMSMILGILLNLILKDKKEKVETKQE